MDPVVDKRLMADTATDLLNQVAFQFSSNGLFNGFSVIIRNPNQKFGQASGQWERFYKGVTPALFVEIGKTQESEERTFANYDSQNSFTHRRYQIFGKAALTEGQLAASIFEDIHDVESAMAKSMRFPTVRYTPNLAPTIWNFELDDNEIYDMSGLDSKFVC